MAKLLINNMDKINYNIIDDVGLGLFFTLHGIHPQSLPFLYYFNAENYISNTVLYRNKRSDRNGDIKYMKIITDQIIQNFNNSKNIKMDYAYYGTDNKYINICKQVIVDNFIVNNKLSIAKTIKFNDIFGDPVYGHIKILKLKINGMEFIINENRDNDIIEFL